MYPSMQEITSKPIGACIVGTTTAQVLERFTRLCVRLFDYFTTLPLIFPVSAIIHTYDDHEVSSPLSLCSSPLSSVAQIKNNFAGEGNDSTPPYPSAVDPFTLYNADANPDPIKKGAYYYSFNRGDVAFFVLDTRRYRTDVTAAAKDEPLTMLGEEQLTALHSWLGNVRSRSPERHDKPSDPFPRLIPQPRSSSLFHPSLSPLCGVTKPCSTAGEPTQKRRNLSFPASTPCRI